MRPRGLQALRDARLFRFIRHIDNLPCGVCTPRVSLMAQSDGKIVDPLWYKDAVIYELHVKTFCDSDGDGMGDFRGLIQKLDYLQELGVTAIWLLPFYPSPLRDDGYDIADYFDVNPNFGTLDDFRAFLDAAHQRNLRVITELVINHTSDQNPWLQKSRRAAPGSPEREFYVWSDTPEKYKDARIIFKDFETSNWAWDPVAKAYYWHRFYSHQPDLNFDNPAVLEALEKVCDFWLALGVDGLRLDAIPYLYEREDTSCENLPETHDYLRKLRTHVDAKFPNRMLLAEANQWPEDAVAYFGKGDESHMNFHFPLMPRMFMALQMEDRFPIIDILEQTPSVPDGCQWAMFLRNHDELTLEMVTDEERDYMYRVYATDPHARINLGIRRRLAPLLANSRRKIELLNTLLCSMPGTPIIYYGDGIGMRDNIYLGDRNGVRTPMQWSPDRNAGFSRADPARLYAPPIQDPVYGYQAINVEAQERYPFSLLNWMKRLIATRRQHRVFGRGSIDFVSCPNRKVLAYLRRDDKETILIVVNLSRTVQPAELDLRSFSGLIPIEMGGLTEFPRIGDQPYFLSLNGYASYWFTLQHEPLQTSPRATAPSDPNALIRDSLPRLLVGTDWQNMLDSGTRTVLEREALAPFIQRQRWFGSKSREIRHARFSDWVPVRRGSEPAFLTIVSLTYADGWSDSYFVPLALISDDGERALQSASSVLARITGARKGAIVDGLYDDDVCDRLLTMIARGEETATAKGSVHGLALLTPPATQSQASGRWTRGSAEQSNSIAFANDGFVLKLFRRIEPTPNPELEIGRVLTEQRFVRTPPLAGALEYLRPGVEPGTLAVVQAAIKHQGSGWEFTIDELRRYYERVSARAKRSDSPDGRERLETRERQEAEDRQAPPPFFAALQHWYLSSATTLGRRTAELHLTLAHAPGDGFAPEPLDRPALRTVADDMREHAVSSLTMLEQRLQTLNDASRPYAEAVLASRDALLKRFDDLRPLEGGGWRIRVHGEYRLGQVRRAQEDFVILDFEGEPARSIAERRAKQSPLKDVAGMVRSFSYAAYAALLAFTIHAPDSYCGLEPWAETWQHWASRSFLDGYRETIGALPLVPDVAFEPMLRAFT